VPLVGVLLLPLILLALPFWVILLRLHERSDAAPDLRPEPAHVEQLAALEDHGPVNQFTAGGFIKPGPFRAVTARVVLFLIAYAVRHVFNRANLAGVKTIHFARWTYIDGGRRVIFASNYDGSLESYMDDFIDKIAWGLNAGVQQWPGLPADPLAAVGRGQERARFQEPPTREPVSDPGLVRGLRRAYGRERCQQLGGPHWAAWCDVGRPGRHMAATSVTLGQPGDGLEITDLQGLLASGFGKLRAAAYLVLNVQNPARAKAWMRELATRLTTAEGPASTTAVNIALTHSGLRQLGLSPALLQAFPTEFAEGMVSEHRSRMLGDSIVLTIADTGIGIAPQSLLRLGKPFEQVESQLTKTYHGSGLGLAIARSLTNLHGGSMRLRSKLGTGTVVCVSLPRDARKTRAKISVAA